MENNLTFNNEEWDIEERCILDEEKCQLKRYVYCSRYTYCPFKQRIYKHIPDVSPNNIGTFAEIKKI
ncbi:MAG: hypothetical protein GYA14_14125 [Ignavibacteria bacterium]|nr:hypothetical protein [Ignavibacteria bacterium]